MRRHRIISILTILAILGMVAFHSVPASAGLTPGTTIAVNDGNWFFSPYNWYVNGSTYAQTQNPGAYLTVGFSGTSAQLTLDLSPLSSIPSSSWPQVRWQIDAGELQTHLLTPGKSQIVLNPAPLPDGAHSLTLWVVFTNIYQDRWIGPAEVVRVTGLVIDAGQSSLAPALRPKRMLFFGDSITEGLLTDSKSGVRQSDATHAYPYTCAAALNAEFGVVAFSGQGWTVSFTEPLSNVPPFPDTWNYQFNGLSRSIFPGPDYLVENAGGPDGLVGADPGQVANALRMWLANVRAEAPISKIFVVVPFGGWERAGVAQGFEAYQSATPDANSYLIDLGPSAEAGLTGFLKGGTDQSYDGVHPTAKRSQELGLLLAKAISAIME